MGDLSRLHSYPSSTPWGTLVNCTHTPFSFTTIDFSPLHSNPLFFPIVEFRQLHSLLTLLFIISQPQGKGKYLFDIGCEQHGQYVPVEQVRIFKLLCHKITKCNMGNWSSIHCACLNMLFARVPFQQADVL